MSETVRESMDRGAAKAEAQRVCPKFAFRSTRGITGTSLYHCPAEGKDIWVNQVMNVPEGDEPTADHPLVKGEEARGFTFVGIVTYWVRGLATGGDKTIYIYEMDPKPDPHEFAAQALKALKPAARFADHSKFGRGGHKRRKV